MVDESFSILIPVYNFDISELVKSLVEQAKLITSNFEILIIDDKSDNSFIDLNKKLNELDKVSFHLLEKNIGRSKIRNLLFEKAKYENCLILDCDVEIVNQDFLSKYFKNLNNNIVVGGHVYTKESPKDKTKYLHWLYGKNIEVKGIEKRLQNPYASFMTNCFAINKSTFSKIKFDVNLTKYGHEDTLFGFELKKKKIEIKHIENPVLHLGIEVEKVFLRKQEEALKNLAFLYKNQDLKNLLSNIKLIKFYNSIFNKFPNKVFVTITYYLTKHLSFGIDKLVLLNFNLWKLNKFNQFMK